MGAVGLACQLRRGLPSILVTGSVDNVEPEKLFGVVVRRAREARGWSQAALANLLQRDLQLNVGGQSGVARIEAGERPTRLNEIALIARFLDIDLQLLLTGTLSNFSEAEDLEMALADATARLEELDRDLGSAVASAAAADAALKEAEQMVTHLRMRRAELQSLRDRLAHSLYEAADARKRLEMMKEGNAPRETLREAALRKRLKEVRDGEH